MAQDRAAPGAARAALKVVHVLAETGFSGGEGQLQLILEHLRAQGHDNVVVLHPGARFADTARQLGARVHFVPLRRWWRPDLWPRLRAILRRERPDVLHFACGRALLVGGLCAVGATARVKLTIRRIDYPVRRGPFGWNRYRLFVDHTVAICDAIVDRLRAAAVPGDRITRIYDGIDPAPWLGLERQRAAARAALGVPQGAQLVTQVGVLRPRKGQHVLLAAFAQLASDFPAARLFLAGGGTELERLRRQAGDLGLEDRVHLPGAVRPIQNVYAASDIFCMPSFHEGLCNACLEASFAGLPQVVSSAGGNAEIVDDGATGSVVPPGDAAALAAALRPYLADPALRAAHGAAGRARSLERFTADRLGAELEQLFQDLVRRSPGGAR
ncbi:MAG: glycosyltransferase [Planctomycetota bacterium]